MGSKVFVHLTNLKLLQIGKTYLKFFVLVEHLIKVHLEYHKKYIKTFFINMPEEVYSTIQV